MCCGDLDTQYGGAVGRGTRAREPDPAGAALDIVHHHKSFDRLHIFDHRAEPAAGDAIVDDVLPAQYSFVRVHVSVRGHADLGAISRRGPTPDPFRPNLPPHLPLAPTPPNFALYH